MRYADLVNPNIGRVGHLLTATKPTVMRPHGMATIVPIYTPGVMDNYLAETIHGFPLLFGSFLPGMGEYALYDRDFAQMRCYRAEIALEDSGVMVEYTAAEHSLFYRVVFPAGADAVLTVRAVGPARRHDVALSTGVLAVSGCAIAGEAGDDVRGYFHAELSEAPAAVRMDGDVAALSFGRHDGAFALELRVGISYIDAAQARDNLARELAGKPFERAVEDARDAWDAALGAIEVDGGSENERVMFYTALYRMMQRMQNISEYGRYYSGYDRQVHADTRDFYVNDGIWDTYRCAHPLQLLMDEDRQQDMVRSYLRMYEQSGWMPSFPFVNGARDVMLGKHATAMIVDTWAKGYRDFDIDLAYEAMLKNADEATKMPWTGGRISAYDECYFEKGFFPALGAGEVETLPSSAFERRQCVSVTLETAYDDWCLAQVAQALGKDADAARFSARAQSYRNVYNPATGFMAPRTADGAWVPDFDPKLSGGQGGRAYFAECNAWTYTWHVQHDIDGLAALMGGKAAMCDRLDALFREQYDTSKFTFLGQFPDSTGLIGQFCMGNEPSFHIPYLYNHGGQPWKTQRRLREIMRLWFTNSPLGICGDEDGGAMSAWYAFSAMGFYPTCPGKPFYDIGSPVFDEVRLRMKNGRTFTIRAENQHPKHKYVQRATLDGVAHQVARIEHAAVAGGGTLVLRMGAEPNREWG